MSVLFLLIPLAMLMAWCFVVAFIIAVGRGQFDDLETPAMRILGDESPPGSGRPSPCSEADAFEKEVVVREASDAEETSRASLDTREGFGGNSGLVNEGRAPNEETPKEEVDRPSTPSTERVTPKVSSGRCRDLSEDEGMRIDPEDSTP